MVIIADVAGRLLAHYELLESIGHGTLGTLHRACDTRSGHNVALRIVRAELGRDRDRAEALVADLAFAATLAHANIVSLLEAGNASGVRYLVHEYTSGRLLSAELTGRSFPLGRALNIAIQIADALTTIHRSGLVLRDLWPGAVMVTDDGTVRLLDCGLHSWTQSGIARRQAAIDPSAVSPDAVVTLRYMAPEQAVSENVDERADVFSLAAILYEMVTGRSPFAATAAQEVVINVLTRKPPLASSLNPLVLPELDMVLATGLAKVLGDRYESASAFRDRLLFLAPSSFASDVLRSASASD
jgi:serine/threonine protein kinase